MAMPDTQKWFVLGTFALTSGFQGFFCMDFASCSEVAKEAFKIDNVQLNTLYSAIFFTSLPTLFAASYYIDRKHFLTSSIIPMSNVASAWLRYFAIIDGNYSMALLSSVISGLGAGVLISSYVPIAARWFPRRQTTLAVTLAVQSNYGGWAIAALILPLVVSNTEDLTYVLKMQALVSSILLVSFFAFHREKPAYSYSEDIIPDKDTSLPATCAIIETVDIPSDAKLAAEDLSIYDSMKRLFSSRNTMAQLFVFSLMGGVSFALPGIQDEMFSGDLGKSNLNASQRSATNFSFILSGVLVGIILGALITKSCQRLLAVKVLIFMSSISLSALSAAVIVIEGSRNNAVQEEFVFGIVFGCMTLAGVGLVSFIGLALGMIADSAEPVPRAYSAGALECFLQIFATVLPLCIVGLSKGGTFCFFAVLSWVATFVLFWFCDDSNIVNKKIAYSAADKVDEATSKFESNSRSGASIVAAQQGSSLI